MKRRRRTPPPPPSTASSDGDIAKPPPRKKRRLVYIDLLPEELLEKLFLEVGLPYFPILRQVQRSWYAMLQTGTSILPMVCLQSTMAEAIRTKNDGLRDWLMAQYSPERLLHTCVLKAAIRNSDAERIVWLIKHGMGVGADCWVAASTHKSTKSLHCLLKEAPNALGNIVKCLSGAARAGRLENLKMLLNVVNVQIYLVPQAAEGGDLETLNYVITRELQRNPRKQRWSVLKAALLVAARCGHVHILKAKAVEMRGQDDLTDLVAAAASEGRVEAFDWLYNQFAGITDHRDQDAWIRASYLGAMKSGSIQILKRLKENMHDPNEYVEEQDVWLAGSDKVLSWLKANGYRFPGEASLTAARRPWRFDLRRWFHAELGYRITARGCVELARRGDLINLRWAIENGSEWNYRVYAAAAGRRRRNILEYAFENGCPLPGLGSIHEASVRAAENLDLETLRWLGNHGFKVGTYCLITWIRNWVGYNNDRSPDKRLDWLLWMVSQQKVEITELCMIEACKRRFPVLIEKLIVLGGPVSQDTVCASIQFGYKGVLEQIENRNHGAGSEAPVYVWRRSDVALAIHYRRFDLVKFLVTAGAPWTDGAMSQLLGHVDLAYLKWMRKTGCDWNTPTSISVAIEAGGSWEKLQWMLSAGAEPSSEHLELAIERKRYRYMLGLYEHGAEMTKKAFYLAVQTGNSELLHWLYDIECPYDITVYEACAEWSQGRYDSNMLLWLWHHCPVLLCRHKCVHFLLTEVLYRKNLITSRSSPTQHYIKDFCARCTARAEKQKQQGAKQQNQSPKDSDTSSSSSTHSSDSGGDTTTVLSAAAPTPDTTFRSNPKVDPDADNDLQAVLLRILEAEHDIHYGNWTRAPYTPSSCICP